MKSESWGEENAFPKNMFDLIVGAFGKKGLNYAY